VKKYYLLGMAIIMILVLSTSGNQLLSSTPDPKSNRADALFAWAMGDFANAAQSWEKLAVEYKKSGLRSDQAISLIQASEACQAMGNIRKAKYFLEKAESIVKDLDDKELSLSISVNQGKIHYQTGEYDQADQSFKICLDQIKYINNEKQKIAVILNYSNLLFARKQYDLALKFYEQCLDMSKKFKDASLYVKISINLIKTQFALNDDSNAALVLKKAFLDSNKLGDNHDKAVYLISIGKLANSKSQFTLAYDALTSACETAKKIGDTRAYSLGLGSLGQLYADNGQTKEAVTFILRAIFAAHEIGATDILYRWQREIGRQYNTLGNIDKAITAYEHAVESITKIKEDLAIDCKKKSRLSFRESVGPVYFELADLLLTRSAAQNDTKAKQADLMAAQNTIEQMKKMELQDYFQDDCIIALKARQSALDKEIPETAVIYPVLLPDRLELIVTIAGTMKSFQVKVNKKDLTSQVRKLRKKLQQPESRFIRHAQKLYKWLIRPVENDLIANKISTLVFVPDGPLRTIPMSALHDGNDFLIKKYAVATTPGLTVTDLVPFRRKGIKILLSGITEAVQGFSPLPSIKQELKEIKDIYDSQLLMDKDFINASIQQSLQTTPYSIVHIASHGQFNKDPNKTFLLTYDDKLTMDRLESLMALSNFRQEPVELLTLSACQTAVGDDRAALGLAGVAIKSGARCSLASLWFINDQATSIMVVDFYKQLNQSNTISKARALQLAQINLMNTEEYSHPAFWASFLLIGSWL